MFEGYTSAVDTSGESSAIDIEEVNRISNELRKSLYDSFEGIPIVVDSGLTGMSWRIAMSQEMFNELEKRRAKQMGVA